MWHLLKCCPLLPRFVQSVKVCWLTTGCCGSTWLLLLGIVLAWTTLYVTPGRASRAHPGSNYLASSKRPQTVRGYSSSSSGGVVGDCALSPAKGNENNQPRQTCSRSVANQLANHSVAWWFRRSVDCTRCALLFSSYICSDDWSSTREREEVSCGALGAMGLSYLMNTSCMLCIILVAPY